MVEPTQFGLMARYNRWMNGNLYEVCAGIPDADRKRDLGAFFRSVHGTLNHILYADRAWMNRFTGSPFEAVGLGVDLYADFDELRREREKTDLEILRWADGLDPEWLARPLRFKSAVDDRKRSLPAWVLVTHMFNHQTHHRGQITTLVTQLGHEPGVTDIPWLPGLAAECD